MDLVIDIGNSSAKTAVFDNDTLIERCVTSNQDLSCIVRLTERYPLRGGIISSVIPLSPTIKRQIKSIPLEFLFLTAETPVPIKICYHTPLTLGVDRIAAAVGGYVSFPGKNILVIDIGTCITYEWIDSKGNYLGGNISPGEGLRFQSLHVGTAQLPIVKREDSFPQIGVDTETAIRSGVKTGIRHEIEGYIRQFKEKYDSPVVIITGRGGLYFENITEKHIFADQHLVLKGLHSILHYNEHKD